MHRKQSHGYHLSTICSKLSKEAERFKFTRIIVQTLVLKLDTDLLRSFESGLKVRKVGTESVRINLEQNE